MRETNCDESTWTNRRDDVVHDMLTARDKNKQIYCRLSNEKSKGKQKQ